MAIGCCDTHLVASPLERWSPPFLSLPQSFEVALGWASTLVHLPEAHGLNMFLGNTHVSSGCR